MIVEMDTNTSRFPYLETILTIKPQSIDIAHRDKNIISILQHNKLLLLNLQDFSSYQTRAVKLGLIISTLHPINAYNSSSTNTILSTASFFYVLHHSLHYPSSTFFDRSSPTATAAT
jgi:hypothetical protein